MQNNKKKVCEGRLKAVIVIRASFATYAKLFQKIKL